MDDERILYIQPYIPEPLGPDNPSLVSTFELDEIFNTFIDDIIHYVFEYLNEIDLVNAAEVCTRFNGHAKDIFCLKYQSIDMDKFKSMDEVKIMLKHFAVSIKSVFACSNHIYNIYGNRFLNDIQSKCLNLTGLHLWGLSYFRGLNTMFKNLEHLVLEGCDLLEIPINFCNRLNVLKLFECELSDPEFIFNRQFPMLREACFIDLNEITGNALNGFIFSNPTLIKLTIGYHWETFPTYLFVSISENLPNLTELEINEIYCENRIHLEERIQLLGKLRSLEVLKLEMCGTKIAPLARRLVKNKTAIEHLKLNDGVIDDDAVEWLSRLKQVKILILSEIAGLTAKHSIYLAKELPKLSEFYFDSISDCFDIFAMRKIITNAKKLSKLSLESIRGIEIDENDYKSLLKIVQSRAENIQLLIEITGDGVSLPNQMIWANQEWLDINFF